MISALPAFGIKEFTAVNSDIERHVEEIRLLGYTIVPDVVSEQDLVGLRKKLDDTYQLQVDEIGGAEELRKMNDSYNVRCLVAYDEQFVQISANAQIMAVVEKLLGEYFILMSQTGLLNVPVVGDQQNAGFWHRDLNYQHFVSSRPLGISSLLCVDPFSEETGGTVVLPCSHKTEAFPSEDFVTKHQFGIDAKPGSCLVFDSMLFHRGGFNRSKNVRRAINHMYSIPFFRQQISLPKALGGKYQDDPFLGKLFGYDCEPASSVREFRAARLARNSSGQY